MDKILNAIFNGAFALIRGPLMLVLMASIVVSLARHRPAELAPARMRRPDSRSLPPA
jgi:hypothetical protein